uniref:Zgc:66426 n=1 Tax=Salarias fasciatus TaxID=181472 RepID=A0A672FJK9_SALFA
MDRELSEEELQDLFAWIDKIPLSRPKRNISRDFSDGVMAAEVVKYFFPKLVDLHNYIPANSTQQKVSNWTLLNRKVFSKLDFNVPEATVRKIALSTAGAVVPVLSVLRERIDTKLEDNSDNTLVEIVRSVYNVNNVSFLLLCLSEPMHVLKIFSDTDPAFRDILQEKEQTVIALQETVEILQMKVSRLEQLLHLKDMRIEDLRRHLEAYKARGNAY